MRGYLGLAPIVRQCAHSSGCFVRRSPSHIPSSSHSFMRYRGEGRQQRCTGLLKIAGVVLLASCCIRNAVKPVLVTDCSTHAYVLYVPPCDAGVKSLACCCPSGPCFCLTYHCYILQSLGALGAQWSVGATQAIRLCHSCDNRLAFGMFGLPDGHKALFNCPLTAADGMCLQRQGA
jgi:hypothetical protein